jgi:hypothetical protein
MASMIGLVTTPSHLARDLWQKYSSFYLIPIGLGVGYSNFHIHTGLNLDSSLQISIYHIYKGTISRIAPMEQVKSMTRLWMRIS